MTLQNIKFLVKGHKFVPYGQSNNNCFMHTSMIWEISFIPFKIHIKGP